MNREQREEIRARAEAATPGPWKARGAYPHLAIQDEEKLFTVSTNMAARPAADAAFIAHARTDVPALLDEIDRLNIALGACQTALNHHLEVCSSDVLGSASALRAGVAVGTDVVELVYGVHVTARDRYETRTDGTSFSRFLQQVVLDELPPAQTVGLLRLVADSIAGSTTAEGSAEGGTSKGSEAVAKPYGCPGCGARYRTAEHAAGCADDHVPTEGGAHP